MDPCYKDENINHMGIEKNECLVEFGRDKEISIMTKICDRQEIREQFLLLLGPVYDTLSMICASPDQLAGKYFEQY